MIIPNEANPGWMKAIAGQLPSNFEFLATKILMGRLSLAYQKNPSPLTAKKCIAELRSFFKNNANTPMAQADLHRIIAGGQ